MRLAVLEEILQPSSCIASVVRHQGMKGKLEETMQRLSPRVDGCYARGSQHYMLFLRYAAYITQERTLSRARLSGQKERVVCMCDEVECLLELRPAGIYFLHN